MSTIGLDDEPTDRTRIKSILLDRPRQITRAMRLVGSATPGHVVDHDVEHCRIRARHPANLSLTATGDVHVVRHLRVVGSAGGEPRNQEDSEESAVQGFTSAMVVSR